MEVNVVDRCMSAHWALEAKRRAGNDLGRAAVLELCHRYVVGRYILVVWVDHLEAGCGVTGDQHSQARPLTH